MNLKKIPPVTEGMVNAIIETPRGSRNKYVYDPESDSFYLKKALPLGMVFPFDFGFIPNTKAADGDPMDILVLMDEPAFQGTRIPCKLVVILEAEQKDTNGTIKRNDRLIGISETAVLFSDMNELSQLNSKLLSQLENFFINYNRQENKDFRPIGWKNADVAMKLVVESLNSAGM